MQIKVDRRFKNGILVSNSYTLGRGWDYVSENNSIATPMDFSKSWARSDFDRLHNYVLSAIYELPWGPGKKWMSEGMAGKIIGGWQLSGLLQVQSGRPLNITGNGALFNTPGNTAYADLTGVEHGPGRLGPGKLYFDPAVYALPAPGTQGNMSRNAGPEGPGFWELDMSLFKRFAVGGGSRFAEFRVDAFNVTNSPRCENPNTGFSTASGNTFGQVTSIIGGATSRSLRFGDGSCSDIDDCRLTIADLVGTTRGLVLALGPCLPYGSSCLVSRSSALRPDRNLQSAIDV